MGAAIIVVNAAFRPISYNSEAHAILTRAPKGAKSTDGKKILPLAISASLSAIAHTQTSPLNIAFSDGRRSYVCRAFVLNGEAKPGSRKTVLIIEPAPPTRAAQWSATALQFGLTEREQQTVGLLALGLTSKEIAARMSISPNTVKSFFRLVMTKLGVNTRSGIIGKLARPQ
jgi:DNA-binding CsgD family transcriptional regulator